MDILQMMYFVAAVESRTLADAAEKLNVSQSTLSQSIKRLEMEYDVELFHRFGRKNQITSVGKVLYEGAVQLLANFDALHQRILLEKNSDQNVIAVAMDAVDVGMESMVAFSKRNRDVVFDPIRGPYLSLQEMLLTHRTDFYLAFNKIENNDIISVLLFSEPLLLLVEKTNPLAAFSSVSMRELSQETLIMMETEHAIRKLFDGFFRAAGVTPRIIRSVGSQELMAQYVQANFGVTFISECIHNTQITRPYEITNVLNTIAVPIEESFCKRDVYICYSSTKKLTEGQRQYLEFMKNYATFIKNNKELPLIG